MKKVIYTIVTITTLSSCATSNYQPSTYTSNIGWQETEAIHENLTQEEINELISECENCDEID